MTGVVCINLSGEESVTIELLATPPRALEGVVDVRVLDSRTLTAGLGTIVLEVAKAARDGASSDEIEAKVNALIPRTRARPTRSTTSRADASAL